MSPLLRVSVLSLAVVVLAGCAGPVGTWTMREIIPAEAGHKFNIQSVTFRADGTYSADVMRGGQKQELTGEYELDKDKQLLTFKDAGGKTRQYHARICGSCGYLEVWNAGDVKEWSATLVRK